MSKVPFLDTTGETYFGNVIRNFKAQGGTILVTGVQDEVELTLQKNGLYAEIGEDNFYQRTGEAINKALSYFDTNKCIGCKHFAFRECQELSRVNGQ